MILFGCITWTPLPLFDGWALWRSRLNHSDFWAWLFTPYNSHRIPIPRLLYLIDERFFHADTRLLTCCTFLAQLGLAVMLYRLITSRTRSLATRLAIGGLILSFLFSGTQWINFGANVYACFVLVFFLSIAALVALYYAIDTSDPAHPRISPWGLSLAGLLAVFATGTEANGLIVWPLFVVMAFVFGARKIFLASLALVATGVVFVYIHFHKPETGFTLYDFSSRLPDLAAFAFAYLGSALDEPLMTFTKAIGLSWDSYRIPLTSLAGTLGCLWFVRLIFKMVRERAHSPRAHWAVLHIIGFIIGSAALTSVGRIQFSVAAALTSRYTMGSVIFFVALIALQIARSAEIPETNRGRHQRLLAVTLTSACLIGGLLQLPKVAYAEDCRRYLSEGEYAIINDCYEPGLWGRFLPAGPNITVIRYFQREKLSSFSREWVGWIGDPLYRHFQITSGDGHLAGAWESVNSLGTSFLPGVIMSGWAYNLHTKAAPARVVFVDRTNKIAGYTAPTRRRSDLDAQHPEFRGTFIGWIGYLPGGLSREVTAYALMEDGRTLCRIGSKILSPTYDSAPAAKAGELIPGVDSYSTAAWASGLPPEIPSAPFPTATWSSRDLKSRTGTLTLGPVKLSPGVRLGLPFITGPSAIGIRVSVVERDTRRIIAAVDLPRGAKAWDFWRLEVPADAPESVVDYVVEDTGVHPDDWVVVGNPRYLLP
jgi:hypothetical protein